MKLIHLNLIRKIVFDQWRGYVLSFCLLFLFGYVNTWVLSAFSNKHDLNEFSRYIPKVLQLTAGIEGVRQLTLHHLIMLAFTHPLPLAVILTFSIGFAAKGFAGEIENGTIDLVMARPITRIQFAASYIGLIITGVAFLTLSVYYGTFVGAKTFGVLFPKIIIQRGALNYFMLHFAFAGLATALSSVSGERSQVVDISIGFVILQIFFELFGKTIKVLNSLHYLTLFSCHIPTEILMTRHLNPLHISILTAVGASGFLFSLIYFNRRDLIK
ncbi:MAG: hypothetical protein B6244_01690 [Candidatus Cloacimonetes bacterium 4572_55]|nr:MAG: hypothetical protein B6244_01690 [Candidatus Cloacimonetes bacterium 4572_55]